MATEAFELLGKIVLDGAEKTKKSLEEIGKSFEKTGKTMKVLGDATKEVGEKLSKGLSAPLALLGGIALKGAEDVQKASGSIQASLGVTKDDADELARSAQKIWSEGFGENVDEVADAIATVGRTMQDVPVEKFGEVAKGAMTVSKIMGEDVNAVVKTSNNLMTHFGLSSQEAFDLITSGYQSGLNFSDEMLDTVNEYAVSFKSAGFDAKGMFSVLLEGAQAGAFNLDKVGDAIKEMNIRMKDGSKTTVDALSGLGFNAQKTMEAWAKGGDSAQKTFRDVFTALDNVKDPLKKNQIGVELLGTQYEDLEKNVVGAIGHAGNYFDNVAGATDKAGKAMQQSFGAQASNLFRQLETALTPLGDRLGAMASKVFPVISDAIKRASDAFSKLSPNAQIITIIFGIIAVAVPPILILIGSLITVLGGLTLPIIGIIVGISALVGAFISAYSTSQTFRDIVNAVFQAIWAYCKVIWDGIVNIIAGAWQIIQGIFFFFKGLLTGNWSEMWNGILEVFNGIAGILVGLFEIMTNTLVGKISGFGSGATGKFMEIMGSIKNAVKEGIDAVVDWFSNIWNRIKMGDIPHIPLPHLKVIGDWSLLPPVMPDIDVDWYQKGGIFTAPSVIGVGENGSEAVVPLKNKFMQPFAQAIAENMQTSDTSPIQVEVPVYLNGREIARTMVADLDKELERYRRYSVRTGKGVGI